MLVPVAFAGGVDLVIMAAAAPVVLVSTYGAPAIPLAVAGFSGACIFCSRYSYLWLPPWFLWVSLCLLESLWQSPSSTEVA